MTEPTFVMAGRDGVLVADGVAASYPTLDGARGALTAGECPIVVGALPFDVARPAALMSPVHIRRTDTLPDWITPTMPTVRITETVPAPEQHRARITTALEHLRDAGSPLHKVVLARALHLVADAPSTPAPSFAASPKMPRRQRISSI